MHTVSPTCDNITIYIIINIWSLKSYLYNVASKDHMTFPIPCSQWWAHSRPTESVVKWMVRWIGTDRDGHGRLWCNCVHNLNTGLHILSMHYSIKHERYPPTLPHSPIPFIDTQELVSMDTEYNRYWHLELSSCFYIPAFSFGNVNLCTSSTDLGVTAIKRKGIHDTAI